MGWPEERGKSSKICSHVRTKSCFSRWGVERTNCEAAFVFSSSGFESSAGETRPA